MVMADIAKTKGTKDNKPAVKKTDDKKKKRRSPLRVVKDSISEMKKVTWPSKKEWINHTLIVTVFCIIMMVVVGVIDWGLSALFSLIVS